MAFKLEIIKKRKDFLKTAEVGDKILGDFFILLARKNDSGQGTRFGFTVTKKTAKRANVRNLMRRRLKEAVRQLDNVASGYDFVIIVRYKMLNASFRQISEALKKEIAKIGL